MAGAGLQDRLHWGFNIAARKIGTTADLYRPTAPVSPIALTHRRLRLHAAFLTAHGAGYGEGTHSQPLYRGIFDAAYTQVGDFLVQDGRIYFIAAQDHLAEPLCIRTNRLISVIRPASSVTIGMTGYGGQADGLPVTLHEGWPASVLASHTTGPPVTGLPTDLAVPLWTVLMPAYRGLILRPADVISDDLGRSATVTVAELTDRGWRLDAKPVSV